MLTANTTGSSNDRDILIPGAELFVASIGADGFPDNGGLRNVGCIETVTLSTEEELKDIYCKKKCKKVLIKSVSITSDITVAWQMKEVSAQNLALFLKGTTVIYDNPHDTTFADAQIVDGGTTAFTLGHWYLMKDLSGARAYNLGAAGCVYAIHDDAAAVMDTTDYEIDEEAGMIRFKSGGTNTLTGAEKMEWDITTAATVATDLTEVQSFKFSNQELYVVIRVGNSADTLSNGDCSEGEVVIPRLSVSSDGEFSLSGDEESLLGVTGRVLEPSNGEEALFTRARVQA